MRPLVFQLRLRLKFKERYFFGLTALPMGMMLAALWPAWRAAIRLAQALEIPPGVPIEPHPNHAKWFALSALIAIVFGAVGYLVGWAINALAARYLFRWEWRRVRDVFWRSEVPESWIAPPRLPTLQDLRDGKFPKLIIINQRALTGRIKQSVELALSILPLACAFGFMGAAIMMWNYIILAFGLPQSEPFHDLPYGWLLNIMMIGSVCIASIAGYLLGWFLNAVACRYLFGWDREKIRRVFLRSELPDHWWRDDAE